jgi:hypothetical protein
MANSSGGHIEGNDRRQAILLPNILYEYVSEDNPVRFIDEFVDRLNLKELEFKHLCEKLFQLMLGIEHLYYERFLLLFLRHYLFFSL